MSCIQSGISPVCTSGADSACGAVAGSAAICAIQSGISVGSASDISAAVSSTVALDSLDSGDGSGIDSMAAGWPANQSGSLVDFVSGLDVDRDDSAGLLSA